MKKEILKSLTFKIYKWLILCRERYLTRDGMKYNKEKAKKEQKCSFFVLLAEKLIPEFLCQVHHGINLATFIYSNLFQIQS